MQLPLTISDIPPLGDEFFKKAMAAWPPVKKQLTIRLDADVLNWLKANGRGVSDAHQSHSSGSHGERAPAPFAFHASAGKEHPVPRRIEASMTLRKRSLRATATVSRYASELLKRCTRARLPYRIRSSRSRAAVNDGLNQRAFSRTVRASATFPMRIRATARFSRTSTSAGLIRRASWKRRIASSLLPRSISYAPRFVGALDWVGSSAYSLR